MKQALLVALLFATIPFTTEAQFSRALNRAKSKVNQRVDQKFDKAIDQTLDKVEGKETASTTAITTEEKTSAKEEVAVGSFSKYDFVAGAQIVYFENFDQEALAELPTGWNTNGTGEIVTLENIPGKWLRMHQPFNYLTSNEKTFEENYTVEFDVVMQLKNNGWSFPTFSVGLISSGDASTTDNELLKGFKKNAAVITTINPGDFKSSRVQLSSFVEHNGYFHSDPKSIGELETHYGKPVHVAIQVQKERLRIWINEHKAFDVPKGVPTKHKMNQLLFQIGITNYPDDKYGMFVSNIKVAQGLPDTRHKLVEEGKFSTTAILFDVNAATIKPESNGILKEIAGVLNEYKDFKVKIIGHTDSDGTDAANLLLSQKRAAAIKEALVADFSVDAARIETDGKGETLPVGDNKSKEGKAQNRRVEFVKN